MNKSVVYIVGATVLLGGGAYLFLKNKKAKDLAELDKLGGTTSGGTTTGGTTTGGTTTGGTTSGGTTSGGTTTGGTKPPLSTTSDGVSPSDANINLANATILVAEIKAIAKEYKTPFSGEKYIKHSGFTTAQKTPEYREYSIMIETYKTRREAKVSELAKLGYKLDAIGQLVKI